MHISDGVFIMSIGSELYSPSPCSVLSPLRGGEGSETNANRGREFCQGLKKKLDFNPSKNISTVGKSGERESGTDETDLEGVDAN